MDIEIQKNAIVSKIVENQQMTYFAIDQGQSIRAHVSPYLALALIKSGEIEFEVGGIITIRKANEFIEMPANVVHALKANLASKMLLIQISEEKMV